VVDPISATVSSLFDEFLGAVLVAALVIGFFVMVITTLRRSRRQ
jgi:hypothetical protein